MEPVRFIVVFLGSCRRLNNKFHKAHVGYFPQTRAAARLLFPKCHATTRCSDVAHSHDTPAHPTCVRRAAGCVATVGYAHIRPSQPFYDGVSKKQFKGKQAAVLDRPKVDLTATRTWRGSISGQS
jgi:hypothetical protein